MIVELRPSTTSGGLAENIKREDKRALELYELLLTIFSHTQNFISSNTTGQSSSTSSTMRFANGEHPCFLPS
jgi:hypothetical protein